MGVEEDVCGLRSLVLERGERGDLWREIRVGYIAVDSLGIISV
jgi:hypothetical protein